MDHLAIFYMFFFSEKLVVKFAKSRCDKHDHQQLDAVHLRDFLRFFVAVSILPMMKKQRIMGQ